MQLYVPVSAVPSLMALNTVRDSPSVDLQLVRDALAEINDAGDDVANQLIAEQIRQNIDEAGNA